MVSFDFFRNLALTFPESREEPHFEKTSFRIQKKIFATYDQNNHFGCLKLTEIDQDVFSLGNPQVIYPVKNKWGKQGWTIFELEKIDEDIFKDALTCAYKTVAPSKLALRVE